MNIRGRSTALVVAMTCALILAIPVATAQEDNDRDTKKIRRDLRVMSRVLTESLGHRDFLPRGALSDMGSLAFPFPDPVEYDYIPTVGAIFTIHVDYPIVEPEDLPAAEPAPARTDEDLWEKYTRSSEEVRRRYRQMRAEAKGSDGQHEDRPGGGRDDHRGPSHQVWAPQSFFASPVNSYDSEKVEQLRAVILTTLAKYGHRLETMPSSERILLVVDGPKMRRPDTGQHRGRPGPPEVIGRVEGGRLVNPRPNWSGHESSIPQLLGQLQVPGVLSSGSHRWGRDRWLFSIAKSELTGAVDMETITDRIEEIRY